MATSAKNAQVAADGRIRQMNVYNLDMIISVGYLVNSKPWNPIIANVFYRAGIIERWGTGTLNIVDWCAENGNPMPTWQ